MPRIHTHHICICYIIVRSYQTLIYLALSVIIYDGSTVMVGKLGQDGSAGWSHEPEDPHQANQGGTGQVAVPRLTQSHKGANDVGAFRPRAKAYPQSVLG